LNAYYEDFIYFRTKNYEFLPKLKPTQEQVMNAYDDDLTKRSVNDKFVFKLFNLYNQSDVGSFIINYETMTEE